MGYIYDDWMKLLETFQQCVDKGIEEIHQQKEEVQQIKVDIFNRLDSGLYYRDNDRIVLSAPEIIIGNVDKSGDLQGGIGRVIVKGSDLAFNGVGETGSIVSCAPSIRQIAVDPGIDGMESVVCSTSEIVSQASTVVIHGSEADGVFSQTAGAAGKGGVFIHADKNLHLEAAVSAETRKTVIEDEVKKLTAQANELKTEMNNQKKAIDEFFKRMNKLHEQEDKLNIVDGFSLRVNMADIDELHKEMDDLLPGIYHSTISYLRCVSSLAEVNRKKKALESEKGTIKTGDDFKKNTTGASMTIKAENIAMATTDGDGNLHTNPEAGVSIHTPRLGVSMADETGKLVENGAFGVNAQNISLISVNPSSDAKEQAVTGKLNIKSKEVNIEAIDYQTYDKGIKEKELTKDSKITMTARTIEVATTNPQNIERDDKGKITKGEYKAEGDIILKSKNFSVESLDYEVKDGKLETKALTKDGKISVRAEKTSFLAADAEGKAAGSFSVNAKAVSVKSMNVDKEKLTDDKLAEGSTMTLVSEKMYVGAKSKDIKSKKLQAMSEEIGAFADKTLEIQQGDGKAVVQLSGGNASMGGSKSQVYGDTTINGKADIKGDVKAPKGQFDNLEAKSSFKSSNISDGIAVPGAAGGGSLSAKLKAEDAPKE
jgi:hypothetical protein